MRRVAKSAVLLYSIYCVSMGTALGISGGEDINELEGLVKKASERMEEMDRRISIKGAERPDKKEDEPAGPNKADIKEGQTEDMTEEEKLEAKRRFEEAVRDLYLKGRKLFKKGLYDNARRLFLEITELFPHYQKTDEYLKRIEEARQERR